MISLDVEQGMATDIGELWESDAEESTEVIVEFARADEDQLIISYGKGKYRKALYVPIQRLKAVLNGVKKPKKQT
jgi:hypothetical protein